jgi:hypothetical protein
MTFNVILGMVFCTFVIVGIIICIGSILEKNNCNTQIRNRVIKVKNTIRNYVYGIPYDNKNNNDNISNNNDDNGRYKYRKVNDNIIDNENDINASLTTSISSSSSQLNTTISTFLPPIYSPFSVVSSGHGYPAPGPPASEQGYPAGPPASVHGYPAPGPGYSNSTTAPTVLSGTTSDVGPTAGRVGGIPIDGDDVSPDTTISIIEM